MDKSSVKDLYEGMSDEEVARSIACRVPEPLQEMQWVYEGGHPRTAREVRYKELLEKDVGKFLDRMEKWERTWRMAFQTKEKKGDLKSFKSEESPAVDEDGGIEQVEEWLRQWKEEHRGP